MYEEKINASRSLGEFSEQQPPHIKINLSVILGISSICKIGVKLGHHENICFGQGTEMEMYVSTRVSS